MIAAVVVCVLLAALFANLARFFYVKAQAAQDEAVLVDPNGVTRALKELLGTTNTFNCNNMLNILLLEGNVLEVKVKS